MTKLNESFEACHFSILDEAKEAEVDGVNILAKVRGKGFVINGASQNKRFYSRGLWEKAIQKTSNLINDRLMFGYLGHGASNGDENVANAALIVTKVELPKQEGNDQATDGIIEYIIPATDAGKALNSLLRAGAKLSVSTRATGESNGLDAHGNEMLDEDSYDLLGIDIVQRPGVKSASPVVIEKLDKKGVTKMSVTLEKKEYEKLVSDKASLEAKLESALEATSKEVEEAKVEAGKVAKQFEAVGSLSDFEEAVRKVEAYAKLGSIEEMEALGTAKEIDDALTRLEAYGALGSIKDIELIMSSMEEAVEKADKLEKEAACKEASKAFAEKHDCKMELAESLLSKMNEEEAEAIVKELPKQKVESLSTSYRPLAESLITGDDSQGKSESLVATLIG